MRKKLSNKTKIKIWQLQNDVLQEHIAKAAGVTNATVSLVVNGRLKTPNVIAAFVAKGCPMEYFNHVNTSK